MPPVPDAESPANICLRPPGLLVEGHAPGSYAAAILQLVEAPRRLESMAVAARDHAERFGWSVTAARTVEVYADALAEKVGLAGRALAATS